MVIACIVEMLFLSLLKEIFLLPPSQSCSFGGKDLIKGQSKGAFLMTWFCYQKWDLSSIPNRLKDSQYQCQPNFVTKTFLFKKFDLDGRLFVEIFSSFIHPSFTKKKYYRSTMAVCLCYAFI